MKRKGEKMPVGRLNENNRRRKCRGTLVQTKINISLGELRIGYDNGLDGGGWLDKKDI
jgi:hypothetical protein